MPDQRSYEVRRTIILPARNEAGYIAEMIRRTIAAGERSDDTFEVIVIDNASEDETAQLVSTLAKEDPRIRLIVHGENLLYAGSCATGLGQARGERTFILDSDGQHDPEDIWKFDAALDRGFDLVFGWRTHRNEPPQRILMSRFLLYLTRFYLGFPLHDVNCGIRAMNLRCRNATRITHRVNFVNPELFVRARQAQLRIGEVPVRQEARQSGVSSHELGRLWLIFRTVESYLRDLRRELRSS